MNEVVSIQIGGAILANNLEDACREFVRSSQDYNLPFKIRFSIRTNDGVKYITIRDDLNKTYAYGNFEGLQNFLEFSQEILT